MVSHLLGVIDDSPIKRYFLNFISCNIFFKKKQRPNRCLARLLKYMISKEYPNLSSLTQQQSFNPTFLITTNPGNPLKNKQRYLSINPEQTNHNLLKDQLRLSSITRLVIQFH